MVLTKKKIRMILMHISDTQIIPIIIIRAFPIITVVFKLLVHRDFCQIALFEIN